MVSFISVLFPILTFILFSVKRRSMERFAFILCFSAFGLNVTVFVGSLDAGYCLWEAVFTHYFTSSLLFGWLFICYFIHQVLIKEIPIIDLNYTDKFFHTLVWGLPVPFTAIPYALKILEVENADSTWECWLIKTDINTQIVNFDGILCLCIILSLLFWPKAVWRLYLLLRAQETKNARFLEYLRQSLFIIVFFLRFLIIFIFHLLDASFSSSKRVVYIFYLFYTFFVCATGMYCFLIIGVSRDIMNLWGQSCSFCPCASSVEQRINDDPYTTIEDGRSVYGTSFNKTNEAAPLNLSYNTSFNLGRSSSNHNSYRNSDYHQ